MSAAELERLKQIIRFQQRQIDLQDQSIEDLKAIAQALIDRSHGQSARLTELENLLRKDRGNP